MLHQLSHPEAPLKINLILHFRLHSSRVTINSTFIFFRELWISGWQRLRHFLWLRRTKEFGKGPHQSALVRTMHSESQSTWVFRSENSGLSVAVLRDWSHEDLGSDKVLSLTKFYSASSELLFRFLCSSLNSSILARTVLSKCSLSGWGSSSSTIPQSISDLPSARILLGWFSQNFPYLYCFLLLIFHSRTAFLLLGYKFSLAHTVFKIEPTLSPSKQDI